MAKDIEGKLMKHLAKPIDDEPDVVYLLAEVRKLLKRDHSPHSNGALRMYCHWALHVDLTDPKTTMDFLKRVDCWITNNIAYLKPSGPWEFMQEHHLFRDFIFLTTFRQQLRDFLQGYGLPLSVCDQDERWHEFIEAYSGVIEDGSLSTKSSKKDELGAVKQVTFSKGRDLSADHHVPFMIQWSIELKDGRTVKTNVRTVPTGGGSMTAHHLEVINGSFIPPRKTPANQTT